MSTRVVSAPGQLILLAPAGRKRANSVSDLWVIERRFGRLRWTRTIGGSDEQTYRTSGSIPFKLYGHGLWAANQDSNGGGNGNGTGCEDYPSPNKPIQVGHHPEQQLRVGGRVCHEHLGAVRVE